MGFRGIYDKKIKYVREREREREKLKIYEIKGSC